jgi:hypothetical protein
MRVPLQRVTVRWQAGVDLMLDSARRKVPVPALARRLLGLGIAATLAANVAHGLGHGAVGATVAAWPAVALVGSYELLMMIIRSTQKLADVTASLAAPELKQSLVLWRGDVISGVMIKFSFMAKSISSSTLT